MKKMVSLFDALADENRLRLLELLQQGETCGCTMIQKLAITQPTMSYHLNILVQANLIIASKKGNWKNYHINVSKLEEIQSFLLGFTSQERKNEQ